VLEIFKEAKPNPQKLHKHA